MNSLAANGTKENLRKNVFFFGDLMEFLNWPAFGGHTCGECGILANVVNPIRV